MDVDFPAAAPVAVAQPAIAVSTPSSTHPLLWAALLVWLSVETIGDGLLALISLLASRSTTGTATRQPQVTAS
ncbi:MAG: hypothetical protein RLZZ219_1170 [Cyanobacteriota bacterium]|jgi:hypothetical protein